MKSGFTIRDLKKIIEHLDDATPVLLVNPVGRGNNQFDNDNIEIADVIIADDGISYTNNMSGVINSVETTKGLLIFL